MNIKHNKIKKIKHNKINKQYIYIYIYEICAWTPNNVFLSMFVVESLSSKLEWDLAQVLCFRSLLLSHKTISGQQQSYVARSVAMQSECNLNSSERGVLCRSAKAPYKEKTHTRRGRTSTPPLPPRRKRALPT